MTVRATATVPRTEPPRKTTGRTTARTAAPPRRRPAPPRTPARKRIPQQAGRGVRLLLAPPPAASSAPRTPFVVLILGLVAGGLVALLLLNTSVNENSFRLRVLQKNQKALDIKEQELRQKVNQLQAPGTLAAAARRLGLVPAGQPAFIRLPDGRILGVPTPAKSDDGDSSSSSDNGQSLVPPNTNQGTGGQQTTGQQTTGQQNAGQQNAGQQDAGQQNTAQPNTNSGDGGAR
ncbi:hypothetical protein [Fodinicola acaciae]|uniref:hypothetical protein n=1 Tax=Fodinicola acaciae TaxID=2681555 RepID=UPI0013D664EB|nr:hypothetical protein [Fodinicola acaciae]